jgi:hypothetical protein
MKKILVIGLLILNNSVTGQIPGKKFDGPIVIFDTLTIKEGDIIFLGKGSDPVTGNFIHITTPRKYMTVLSGNKSYQEFKNTPQGISSMYNDRSFAIEHFSKASSRKKDDLILGIISIGGSFDGELSLGMYKQAVDFEVAILAGEIIKINDIDFNKKSSTIKNKRNIPQFVFIKDSIQPIFVAFENKSIQDLYTKTLQWYNANYENKAQNPVTTVENKELTIAGVKKSSFLPR